MKGSASHTPRVLSTAAVLAVVVALLFVYVNRSRIRPGDDVPISRTGIYKLQSGNRFVAYDDNHIIKFKLEDAAGNVLATSDIRPSGYSRWIFFVESPDETVWMYSGDIGQYVWRKGEDGRYGASEDAGPFLPDGLQRAVDRK